VALARPPAKTITVPVVDRPADGFLAAASISWVRHRNRGGAGENAGGNDLRAADQNTVALTDLPPLSMGAPPLEIVVPLATPAGGDDFRAAAPRVWRPLCRRAPRPARPARTVTPLATPPDETDLKAAAGNDRAAVDRRR